MPDLTYKNISDTYLHGNGAAPSPLFSARENSFDSLDSW